MDIKTFLKSKYLAEYLNSRRNADLRRTIQNHSRIETLLHHIRTTKINSENHRRRG